MDKKKLSLIFKDPVYAGVVKYGNQTEEYFEALKAQMAIESDEEMKKIQKQKNKETKEKLNKLFKQREELEKKIKNMNRSIDTYEEFLELFDNMPKTLRNLKNMSEMDMFIKKFFSNFSVNQKNVVAYTLNAPFGTLECVNDVKVADCGANPDKSRNLGSYKRKPMNTKELGSLLDEIIRIFKERENN